MRDISRDAGVSGRRGKSNWEQRDLHGDDGLEGDLAGGDSVSKAAAGLCRGGWCDVKCTTKEERCGGRGESKEKGPLKAMFRKLSKLCKPGDSGSGSQRGRGFRYAAAPGNQSAMGNGLRCV